MKNLFSLLLVFFGFVTIASASVATVPIVDSYNDVFQDVPIVDSYNDVFQDVPIVLTVSETADSLHLLSVFEITNVADISTGIFETYFLIRNVTPDSYSFMDPGNYFGALNLIYTKNQRLKAPIDLQDPEIVYRISPFCTFIKNATSNEFWTGNYLV